MNITDRWISECSCGVDTMYLHHLNEKEQEFLLKRKGYCSILSEANWHDSFKLEKPFKHTDSERIVYTLDPLIYGLVLELLSKNLDTITSCQGKENHCPYIYTYATTKQLDILSSLFRNKDWNNHWNNVLITFENIRDKKPSYLIQFYDIIAVLYHYKQITGLNPYNIPDDIFIYNNKN